MSAWRYWPVIIEVVVIAGIFFAVPLLFAPSVPFAVVLYALGGLAMTIPITHLWAIYQAPILSLTGVETAAFDMSPPGGQAAANWRYNAQRIIVENTGRTAGKNCKAWLVTQHRKERVCWTVPQERPNATINSNDSERLDFCAYYVSGPQPYVQAPGIEGRPVPVRIAPTENGWASIPFECRNISDLTMCKVLITCENSRPVERGIAIELNEITLGPIVGRASMDLGRDTPPVVAVSDERKAKLDDTVKLLLVLMSILYTTSYGIERITNPSNSTGLFWFPIVAIGFYAFANLGSGKWEQLGKSFGIYFMIYSIGQLMLIPIFTSPSSLLDFKKYFLSAATVMIFAAVFSGLSVRYVNGNFRLFRTLPGWTVFFFEAVLSLSVAFILVLESLLLP